MRQELSRLQHKTENESKSFQTEPILKTSSGCQTDDQRKSATQVIFLEEGMPKDDADFGCQWDGEASPREWQSMETKMAHALPPSYTHDGETYLQHVFDFVTSQGRVIRFKRTELHLA